MYDATFYFLLASYKRNTYEIVFGHPSIFHGRKCLFSFRFFLSFSVVLGNARIETAFYTFSCLHMALERDSDVSMLEQRACVREFTWILLCELCGNANVKI